MKIYTKVGDKGKTKFRGQLIPKGAHILEVLGGLDEAQAAIGLIYEVEPDYVLEKVMREIYHINGMIYREDFRVEELEMWVEYLEFEIDKRYSPIDHFILPTKCARAHYARTVVRRVERLISDDEWFSPIWKYLNRLSDLLFVFACNC